MASGEKIIISRFNTIKRKMEDVVFLADMIDKNNFEEATVHDMAGNAKDKCDLVKAEVDLIKGVIDEWDDA